MCHFVCFPCVSYMFLAFPLRPCLFLPFLSFLPVLFVFFNLKIRVGWHSVWMLDIYGIGLAVAVVAYASQSAQLTHRDSPLAVIVFATTSILLFTLPRVGGDSRIPHVVVILFGFTTILGYLFGMSYLLKSHIIRLILFNRFITCNGIVNDRCRSRRLRLRFPNWETTSVSYNSAAMQKGRRNLVARSRPLVPSPEHPQKTIPLYKQSLE